jgi:hypothetical protein
LAAVPIWSRRLARSLPPSEYFELDHPVVAPPDDPRATLWRYMDFTKFVDLLARRALWFSRADLLGDPWEGTYTRANLKKRLAQIGAVAEPSDEVLRRNLIATERSIYVNCWHMNEGESAAMWKLYLSAREGVAVQST